MIGIFDSGIGGLTVVREIFRQMSGYDTIYFGDTARTPYGNKSPNSVSRFAVEDADFLISQGAKVIVVACNTVSAVAVSELRKHLDIPVIEVVTPAVEEAVRQTKGKGRVGVIGTRATVGSGIYDRKISALAPKIRTKGQACPLFVSLVEEGWLSQPETQMVANKYLSSLKWPKTDALILGCTHYPFLKPIIRKAVGKQVKLIDPARETVRALRRLLDDNPKLDRSLSRRDRHKFFVSDRTEQFSGLAASWLGRPVRLYQVNLE